MIKLHFDEYRSGFLDANNAFRVTEITHVFGNPNWVFHYHSHDDLAEVIYIADGRGVYRVGGAEYHVARGDLLLINANVIHCISSDPDAPLDAWTLTMTGIQLEGLLPNYIIAPGVCPYCHTGEQGELIRMMLERIFTPHLQSGEGHDIDTNDLTHMMGLSLLLLAKGLAEQGDARRAPVRTETARRALALDVLHYIDRHYKEPISMDQLAGRFHASVGHLGHVFTGEFGVSPINYQISRRLSDAQWLLIRSTKSVSEIGRLVGYDNSYHFTKLFTRHIGMHPQEFRERHTSLQPDGSALFE